MFILSLAVNDDNGSVTDTCLALEIELNGETVMRFECEIAFAELPGDCIRLGKNTYRWLSRGEWVGNMSWNAYRIAAEDAVHLVNYLKFADELNLSLDEAYRPLWDQWKTFERFTHEDFVEAVRP